MLETSWKAFISVNQHLALLEGAMHLANCGGCYFCGQPHSSGLPALSHTLGLFSGPLVQKETVFLETAALLTQMWDSGAQPPGLHLPWRQTSQMRLPG